MFETTLRFVIPLYAALAVGPAFALDPHGSLPPAYEYLRAEWPEARWVWAGGAGNPHLITHINEVIGLPRNEAVAAFLSGHPDLLGGLALGDDLILGHELKPFGSGFQQTLKQHWDGIPIEGRGGWVWMDRRGQIKALRLDLSPRPKPVTFEPLSKAAAEVIASELLNSTQPRIFLSTLVYDASTTRSTAGSPPKLAWRVHVYPETPMPEDRFLYIDAETGQLLREEDRALHAGQAHVFLENPVVDDWQTSTVDLTQFGPLTQFPLANAQVSATACLDRGQLMAVDSDYGLVDVHICSVEPAASPDALGDYLYQPDYLSPFDALAEVNAFYHANVAIDFFESLGAVGLSNVPIQVLSNYQVFDGHNIENMSDPYGTLLTVTNAYFTHGSVPGEEGEHPGRLLFGQGSNADIAYDGDVVYHEFGHAVVASLNGPRRTALGPYGMTNEAPALNEAFADYFACALTGDPLFAEYGSYSPSREGVGGWRNLENDYNCRDDIYGGPHGDGRIWSGALWSIRSGAAKDRTAEFDVAILESLRGMGAYASFEVAATLTLAVIEDRLGPEIAAAALEEFEARFLLGGCVRWHDAEGGPTSLSSSGKGAVPLTGPAPGTLQLRLNIEETGGDLVIRGNQSHLMSSRLHIGGYNKDPNLNLRILARKGQPISYHEIGGSAVGVYDLNVPLLPTGNVYETTYVNYPEFEARLPIGDDEAGIWYILLGSNENKAGSLIWMNYSFEDHQAVIDTQPGSVPGPTLERAHLRCNASARGGVPHGAWLVVCYLVIRIRGRRKELDPSDLP